MKWLTKSPDSAQQCASLSYERVADREPIRAVLCRDQFRFCAYTERYFERRTSSKDIEHFNPDLKNTPNDGYQNWYLVHHHPNNSRPRNIAEYGLEAFKPAEANLSARIYFDGSSFLPRNPNDAEAKAFIKFVGLDREELFEEVIEHLERLEEIHTQLMDGNTQQFIEKYLMPNPAECSFATAIEFYFGIDIRAEYERRAFVPKCWD